MRLRKILEDIYPDALLALLAFAYIVLRWQNDGYQIVGVCIAVVSAILWVISRVQLGASFEMGAHAKELVSGGLYSKIRNPMYVFSTIMVLGLVTALKSIYLYGLVALLAVLQIYRAKREASVLQTRFGQKYIDYKKTTWF